MNDSAAFLPYGRQLIQADDIDAVVSALQSDYLTTGPLTETFESALAARTGAAAALACSSGTAALHLATLALGIGPGDTVVVPTITFLATANVVRMAGGEVVFADVDPDTGMMGPAQLAAALEHVDNAAAVFPVHLAGQVADMQGIAGIAREHGLKILEDACHAIGTEFYAGNGGTSTVGACDFSDACAFSFHPVKTIAMGEGGAVTAADPALIETAKLLRSHGVTRDAERFQNADMAFTDGKANPWYYEMHEIGFNYRPSEIHAALAHSQLSKLDRFADERRRLVARYDSALAPLAPVVRPLARVSGCSPAWHLYVVLIDFARAEIARAQLMDRLRARGIGTQVHFIPVHRQPYYARRYDAADLPGAETYYARCLSLPLFVGMTDDDVDSVVDALRQEIGAG